MVGGGLASTVAEVYTPGNGEWTTTDGLATGRGHHTATLLDNGKVLVAGGDVDGGSQPLASADSTTPRPRPGHPPAS